MLSTVSSKPRQMRSEKHEDRCQCVLAWLIWPNVSRLFAFAFRHLTRRKLYEQRKLLELCCIDAAAPPTPFFVWILLCVSLYMCVLVSVCCHELSMSRRKFFEVSSVASVRHGQQSCSRWHWKKERKRKRERKGERKGESWLEGAEFWAEHHDNKNNKCVYTKLAASCSSFVCSRKLGRKNSPRVLQLNSSSSSQLWWAARSIVHLCCARWLTEWKRCVCVCVFAAGQPTIRTAR